MTNWLRTTILLAMLTALFLGVGHLIGGQEGMIVAFLFALIMNAAAYWFSDRFVLSLYQAEPLERDAASELYQIVEKLSKQAGIPFPRIYLIHSTAPNAFATGRNPQHAVIAVTDSILQLLTPEELTGVLAHEISHIKHYDILISTVAATIAGTISMLTNMAQFAFLFGRREGSDQRNGFVSMLLLIIVAPLAAALIQLAVSRSREFAADGEGAKLCQQPLWLAQALRKLDYANQKIPFPTAEKYPATAHLFIVSPLHGNGLIQLFSTHPPLEERIRRLNEIAKFILADSNVRS